MGSTNSMHKPIGSFTTMFSSSDEQLDNIPTAESFTRVLDVLVSRYHLSYCDAIVELCEHYGREYDSVRKLLTPRVKAKVTEEAAQRGLLKDKTLLGERLI